MQCDYVTLGIINKIRRREQVHNAKKSTILCQFTPVRSRAEVFLLVLFEHTFKVQGNLKIVDMENVPYLESGREVLFT